MLVAIKRRAFNLINVEFNDQYCHKMLHFLNESLGSALIEIRDLNKDYKNKIGGTTRALNNINLTIADGEFVAIVGPSGCGKTTLLKILAGLEQDFDGVALIDQHPVTKPSLNIGMVFQEPTLLPWRTVIENVLLPIELRHLDKQIHYDRAVSLLEKTGLKGLEDKYPSELSGGMRQRAGICRALICDPQVLLMDEPFASLDAMSRELLNNELQHLWLASKKTIIFVTHSISEAVFLADKVVVMRAVPGHIVETIAISVPRERKHSDLSTLEMSEAALRIRNHFSQNLF